MLIDQLDELRSELGPSGVLMPVDDLTRYEHATLFDRRGRAAFVARPRSTEEVRAVVRWAYRHRVRIVAQGANTGLVDAGLPDGSGTMGVVSLELCKQRLDVDVLDRTMTASAGFDLDALNEHLAEFDLMLPVDLGSSPAVGGMISTNTGGTRVVRYGDVRRLTRGVEVVLADEDATVVDLLSALRKNNTGLDLAQIFLGTGGTYGIVTAATFELVPRPKQVVVSWVAAPNDSAAFALLQALEHTAGEYLTSFEAMSGRVLRLRKRHNPDLRLPFADDQVPPLALLVELSSATSPQSGLVVEDLLLAVLEEQSEVGNVIDAVVGPPDEMWAVRHGIDETTKEGYQFWVDVAFPRSRIADFRTRFDELLTTKYLGWVAVDLGHYGDGGLHAAGIYSFDHGVAPTAEEIETIRVDVYDLVAELGGTFSAEHGIGPYNARYYHRYKDPVVQRLSGELKKLLDPRGILGVVELGPAPATA